MKKRNKLSQFFSDTSGNIAIMTAITLPVLLIGIGSAVSLSDVYSKKSKLQSHADIMSLAMAKQKLDLTEEEARAYFYEYMSSVLKSGETCEFSLSETESQRFAEATVTCKGEIASFMAGFLSKKTVPYSVSSTAILEASSIFEVAFVFDISLSMDGAEITDLKNSLIAMSESDLFQENESRISLIPFANTVRLGPEFEHLVTPGTGYAAAGGVYNGCFDRDLTDPNLNLNNASNFSLVRNTLNSGKTVCQNEKMTAVFQEEPTDWSVKDIARDIETAFGTGMSDGLVWGFRSLDPGLRGVMSKDAKYPLPIGQSSKHVIMMTDGRPYDRPWSGPGGGSVTQKISLDRFEAVCAALPFDANEISFHLINYNNKSLSPEHLDVFKGCVRGEGKFHDVSTGNLAAVIDEIAGEVTTLRLTQ